MWTKFKERFLTPQKNSAGDLPPPTAALTECYAKIDDKNWWQGDVYRHADFAPGVLPDGNYPFWMLLNRTCHLYAGNGRPTKLPYLNFCALQPIARFLSGGDAAKRKKHLHELLKREEKFLFLPEHPTAGVFESHVVHFNLVHTVAISNSPLPAKKVVQLSSPFCEHAFQKFSLFFYTVGFDDQHLKSDDYINQLATQVEADLQRQQ